MSLTPQLFADLETLEAEVQADYEQRLAALFEHFHANPELSFVEFKTAARMADEMQALGYDVTSGIGGTGVIGVLENGPGPLVMMRADMDGPPVREETGLPYASRVMQETVEGNLMPVMHACGHDVHITALIGTARYMANDPELARRVNAAWDTSLGSDYVTTYDREGMGGEDFPFLTEDP